MKLLMNNMNVRIFAIFATVLMLGTLAMPVAVAAARDERCYHEEFLIEVQYMDEEERSEAIDELLSDLEGVIDDFNYAYIEASAEGYGDEHIIEAVDEYVQEIVDILLKLGALGFELKVMICEYQEAPLVVMIDGDTIILVGSDDNPIPAKILLIAAILKKCTWMMFVRWNRGRCIILVCILRTPDGPRGDLFCGHPWCPATALSLVERFGP